MGDKIFQFLNSYMPPTPALIIAVGIIYLLLPGMTGSLTYLIKRLFRRPTRKLLWRVYHRTRLPEVSENKLSVLVNGKPVKGAGLVMVGVSSEGEEAVSADQVDKGMIALTFGEAQVESCVPLSKRPEDLQTEAVGEGNTLRLNVSFLNRGESSKFEVVLSNFDERRDAIKPVGRLRDGVIRLVEWDRPGKVDGWGNAFTSSFSVLFAVFLLLFVMSLQLFYSESDSFIKQLLSAVAFALVAVGTHCWIATEAKRADDENRAFGASHSALKQAWVPLRVYIKSLFTSRFYLKMLVVGMVFGLMPYAMSWLSVLGKRIIEAAR